MDEFNQPPARAEEMVSFAPVFTGPLFLVGMPRSGTKLLRDLLNQHPRIGIPDAETEFLPWLARRALSFGNLSERAAFDRLHRHLSRHSFFKYCQSAGTLVTSEDWYSCCHRFDAAGVFEALIRLVADAPSGGPRIWGDKSPSYINDLCLISQLYPESRFVHIVRDVRDYCVSMNTAWGKDMPRAAQRWSDDVSHARREGSTLGKRYIEVKYEDLLRSPATVLARISSFLDIEFQSCMLSLPRPSENLGSAKGARYLVPDNYGKFASHMAPQMIAEVESLAGVTMQKLDYALSSPSQPSRRLSRLRMALAQLYDGLQLVRHRPHGDSILAALKFHVRYFFTTRG